MELTLSLPHGDKRLAVTGIAEQNLKIIRESLGVKMSARNGNLRISGDDQAVKRAAYVVEQLSKAANKQRTMERQELLDTIASVNRQSVFVVGTLVLVGNGSSTPGPFR